VFEKYLFMCVRTCDIGYFTFGKTTSNAFDDVIIGIDDKSGSSYQTQGQQAQNSQQEAINFYFLVFGNFIISIHSEPISHVRHVIRRMYPLRNLFHVTSDWIMYALLDDVVDEFIPNMKTMELEVDSIDDLVLVLRQTDQADMLRRIGRARNQVTHMLRLLKPKTEIIKILTKRTADRLQSHTLLYLRDIQDHLVTMIQNLDQSGETLNRAHNNYLAQISIELAEMSNRMNLQVKKLTEITSLALPFAIIGSLWGMNVIVPMEKDATSWASLAPFFSLVFLSILLAAAFWIIGRRLRFF
jgi:magnesium transporter